MVDPSQSILRMNRLLPAAKPLGPRIFNFRDSDSDDSSSDEDTRRPTAPPPSRQLNDLAGALNVLKESLAKQVDVSTPRPPAFSLGIPPGVDAKQFKLIYDLGFEAGLNQRAPPDPCGVCIERRRRNAEAAREARKRKLYYEEK